ncbi:MAG: hypothetical protein ABL893_19295, partial [Hyphomicrobium sp.]
MKIWKPPTCTAAPASYRQTDIIGLTHVRIRKHGEHLDQPDRDFLAERKPLAKHIVTNPPYGRGLADAFAKHAIRLTRETGGTVAMLMNLAGLCHPLRHGFYVSHPPAAVYCLDECICWPYGDPSRATTSIAKQRYCWMVWKHDHTGATELHWLSTRD